MHLMVVVFFVFVSFFFVVLLFVLILTLGVHILLKGGHFLCWLSGRKSHSSLRQGVTLLSLRPGRSPGVFITQARRGARGFM